MRVFKATGLRYPINIVSGGEGVYILSGVKEKRQESEIDTLVWVFHLLLAGIVAAGGGCVSLISLTALYMQPCHKTTGVSRVKYLFLLNNHTFSLPIPSLC